MDSESLMSGWSVWEVIRLWGNILITGLCNDEFIADCTIWRWSLFRKKVVVDVTQERIFFPQFPLSLPHGYHDMSSFFYHAFTMPYLFWGLSNMDWKPLKPLSYIKPPFFKLQILTFLSHFVWKLWRKLVQKVKLFLYTQSCGSEAFGSGLPEQFRNVWKCSVMKSNDISRRAGCMILSELRQDC